MVDIIIIIGILILLYFLFCAKYVDDSGSVVIIRGSQAQKTTKNNFIRMLEDAQETFISLYKNLSESEWRSHQDFLANTCSDLEAYIKMAAISGDQQAATEYATKHAYDPKLQEVDRQLFCVLKNLQLLKNMAAENGSIDVYGAIDMRWYEFMRTLHDETKKIVVVSRREERAVLVPDYIKPKRSRCVRGLLRQVDGENYSKLEAHESTLRPANKYVPECRFNKWPQQVDNRLEKETFV